MTLTRHVGLHSTPFPPRTSRLEARTRLSRKKGFRAASTERLASVRDRKDKSAATGEAPIPRVSRKRAAENRERAAMADRLWPERREGTVMCGCGRPDCHRRATDLHEPLTRARGGGIADEQNAVPLARACHDEIQLGPDWAYRSGLIKHSGLCCQGRTVCSRYAEDGAP